MAEYCTEDDLQKIRPNIMSLGVDDWSDQIEEAGFIVDRAIDTYWYRRVAEENDIDWRETPFDRELCLNASTELKRLACYKTLEICFLYLMKHMREADAFEREREIFKKMYNEELLVVLDTGVGYDWDEDDEIASGESLIPSVRRLTRV